jgi:hypothetical protein
MVRISGSISVFQDCRVGQAVAVKSTHPLIALGKARLLEIGSNTVTVCTAEERFELDKADVVLLPLENLKADIQGSGGLPGLDPTMYDGQIATLKDFIRRAEGGEKFEFPHGPVH